VCIQRRAQTEVACLNSVELETALLQLKVVQQEQTEATPGANTVEGPPISPQVRLHFHVVLQVKWHISNDGDISKESISTRGVPIQVVLFIFSDVISILQF